MREGNYEKELLLKPVCRIAILTAILILEQSFPNLLSSIVDLQLFLSFLQSLGILQANNKLLTEAEQSNISMCLSTDIFRAWLICYIFQQTHACVFVGVGK